MKFVFIKVAKILGAYKDTGQCTFKAKPRCSGAHNGNQTESIMSCNQEPISVKCTGGMKGKFDGFTDHTNKTGFKEKQVNLTVDCQQ
jgi:hypothetical protein